MKKILILLLLALWALTACSRSSSPDPAAPTGVSSDEIDQPQIMYGDEVYYYFATGFDEALPEHYAYAGAVKDVDNKNPPGGNFSACRLEEGQKVYADGDNTWSLEPNTVYTDWNWILIRENETSDWIVDDYGNP